MDLLSAMPSRNCKLFKGGFKIEISHMQCSLSHKVQHQPHKMIKYSQATRSSTTADELFLGVR